MSSGRNLAESERRTIRVRLPYDTVRTLRAIVRDLDMRPQRAPGPVDLLVLLCAAVDADWNRIVNRSPELRLHEHSFSTAGAFHEHWRHDDGTPHGRESGRNDCLICRRMMNGTIEVVSSAHDAEVESAGHPSSRKGEADVQRRSSSRSDGRERRVRRATKRQP